MDKASNIFQIASKRLDLLEVISRDPRGLHGYTLRHTIRSTLRFCNTHPYTIQYATPYAVQIYISEGLNSYTIGPARRITQPNETRYNPVVQVS